MSRRKDYLCDFERRHPILFGWILAMLILVLYIVTGDSSALFVMTGRPS